MGGGVAKENPGNVKIVVDQPKASPRTTALGVQGPPGRPSLESEVPLWVGVTRDPRRPQDLLESSLRLRTLCWSARTVQY